MSPFRALWAALRDMFDELLLLGICNILWLLINAPLLGLSFVALGTGASLVSGVLALLAVLSLGPTTAGLYHVAHRIVEGRASTWRDFFVGMRQYAKPSWKLAGIWMIVFILIVSDLAFYSGITNTFGLVMIIVWLNLLALWLGALIYIFPLMLLQEEPSLKLLARNTLLMAAGRPLFTVITLILMLVVVALSVFIPIILVLIGVALLAQWSFRATLTLVKESEERRAALEEAKAGKQIVKEEGRRGQVRSK